jgi:plasmid stabilization system protein ParE
LATVIWTSEALTNLAGIRAYIDQFSPLNSQRFSAKLVNAVETLAENPNRGRPVRGGRRKSPPSGLMWFGIVSLATR